MKFTRPKIIAGLLIALTVIALAGAAKAYFTDHSEKVNTFTSGNVDIILSEEKFDSAANAERKNMICPNEKIVKDPQITNVGENDCYVFIEFVMPISHNAYVDSEGNKYDPKNSGYTGFKEAFSFAADKNWVLVKKENVESPVSYPDSQTVLYDTKYIYAYAKGTSDQGEMITLRKGETTSCVFADEMIQYGNFIESDLRMRTGKSLRSCVTDFEIPVKAYATQTFDSYGESIKNDPLSVYNIFVANLRAVEGGKMP